MNACFTQLSSILPTNAVIGRCLLDAYTDVIDGNPSTEKLLGEVAHDFCLIFAHVFGGQRLSASVGLTQMG